MPIIWIAPERTSAEHMGVIAELVVREDLHRDGAVRRRLDLLAGGDRVQRGGMIGGEVDAELQHVAPSGARRVDREGRRLPPPRHLKEMSCVKSFLSSTNPRFRSVLNLPY